MRKRWFNSETTRVLCCIMLIGAFVFAGNASAQELNAVHSIDSDTYEVGSTLTVMSHITYEGDLTAIGVELDLPDGWTYVEKGGDDVPNVRIDSGNVELSWLGIPDSPIDFTYTVGVPEKATGEQAISATVIYRRMGGELREPMTPDPLRIDPTPDDAYELIATHESRKYIQGEDLRVENEVEYTGFLSGLGIQVDLPDGWSYVSHQGDGESYWQEIASGSFEIYWITPPASPIQFTYTAKVPPATYGIKEISALVLYRRTADELKKSLSPDPLMISWADSHGYIEGTVTPAEASTRIATSAGGEAWTEADGSFVMYHVAGQDITLTAESEGYKTFTTTVTVSDLQATRVDITLTQVDTEPAASISVSPEDATIDKGGSVEFYGTVTGGNAPFTYLWDFGGGPANVNVKDPESIPFPDEGVYPVTFTVTDDDGDESSASVTVTVNKPVINTAPVASIASPPSDMTIFEGESVNFAGEVQDGNAPFTYLWNFNGGAVNSDLEDPGNVTFQTEGLYIVTFTVTDEDGDENSDSVAITVKAVLPDTVPTASITSPNRVTTIYEGESLDFQGTVTGGNAPFTYAWNFDGATANVNVEDPENVTFHSSGIYTVTFTVTEANKPEDTSNTSVTVRVLQIPTNTRPVASIASPLSNVTISEGESVSFEGTVISGNSPFFYIWDFGEGATNANVEDPGDVPFHTAGVYTVTFTVTEMENYSDTSSDSVTITVTRDSPDTKPDAVIGSPPSNRTIYEGESLDFQGTVTNGNAPFIYSWDFDEAVPNANVEDPGDVTFHNVGTYKVLFTVTEANNAEDTDSHSVTIRVITRPTDTRPIAAMSSPLSDATIYEGESVRFEGTVASGNVPFRYAWDFSGAATSVNMEDPGNVTFHDAGVYPVTFTVTEMDKPADTDTASLIITVRARPEDTEPEVSILLPVSDMIINEGESVNFEGSVTQGNAPYAYSWDFGGAVENSDLEDPGDITFPTKGEYKVIFTVTDHDMDVDGASVTITVNESAENTWPKASISSPLADMLVNEGESVNFQGSLTQGNAPFTYSWDFGGAAASDMEDPGHVTFSDAGRHMVTFTVKDEDGETSTDSITITVEKVSGDVRPIAAIESPQMSDVSVQKGKTLLFQGNVTSGNAPFVYRWDFSGGAVQSSVEDPGLVIFDREGVYLVTFTVTDADGDVSSDSLTVTVTPSSVVEGYMITSELRIGARIHIEGGDPIQAVWKPGGEDTTTDGNSVVWGYFYASPTDVDWGSYQNPDLFVKVWFDRSGRIDVNYFHVSVPNIEVYSDYPYDGEWDSQDMTDLGTRYIRQYYEGAQGNVEYNTEDGLPAEGYEALGDPSGNSTINGLRIGSVIRTEERGSIDAIWRLGGVSGTTRGDQVVWGLFHADPNQVTWGNRENPDVFVKIWFDVTGRIDVNFFHVSVPDIEVFSDFPEDGGYDQRGVTIMRDRYIRHEYSR